MILCTVYFRSCVVWMRFSWICVIWRESGTVCCCLVSCTSSRQWRRLISTITPSSVSMHTVDTQPCSPGTASSWLRWSSTYIKLSEKAGILIHNDNIVITFFDNNYAGHHGVGLKAKICPWHLDIVSKYDTVFFINFDTYIIGIHVFYSCIFSSVLNNWWFSAHLTDLLHHCGKLETQSLE